MLFKSELVNKYFELRLTLLIIFERDCLPRKNFKPFLCILIITKRILRNQAGCLMGFFVLFFFYKYLLLAAPGNGELLYIYINVFPALELFTFFLYKIYGVYLSKREMQKC